MSMTNEEIARYRTALGMSRSELALHAGITLGAMASIESGRGTRDANARTKVEASLKVLLAPKEKPDNGAATNRPPIGRKRSEGRARPAHWTIVEDWNGMRPGSRFVVTGISGEIFTFVEFVRNEKSGSEWVTGHGGVPGPKGTSTTRSFRPELVGGL